MRDLVEQELRMNPEYVEVEPGRFVMRSNMNYAALPPRPQPMAGLTPPMPLSMNPTPALWR